MRSMIKAGLITLTLAVMPSAAQPARWKALRSARAQVPSLQDLSALWSVEWPAQLSAVRTS